MFHNTLLTIPKTASPQDSKPQIEGAIAKLRDAHNELAQVSLQGRGVLEGQLREAQDLIVQALRKLNTINGSL
jgi:hypothetical protein